MNPIKKDLSSVAPMVLVFLGWSAYMAYSRQWDLFLTNWFMSVTMVFGSFVAGSTPQGGGAIAFPAMTLIFDIPPSVARNFSLAIQSFGMTSAAYLIWKTGIAVDKTYVRFASLGGVGGFVLGAYWVDPLVQPAYAKMLFVSFWLSFGCILYYENHVKNRMVFPRLPELNGRDRALLVLAGGLGGILSSILGSGIDILTFSYVTMRYRLSEKVAIPSSVVVMAGNTVVGFLLHRFWIRDFGVSEFNFWLVCIPVVIIGAPFGAYFINQRTRRFVLGFLYFLIVAQFVAAWVVERPTEQLLLFSIGIFLGGLAFFTIFARMVPAGVPAMGGGAGRDVP